jgi:hypothetical protein
VSIQDMLEDDRASQSPTGWPDAVKHSLVALHNSPRSSPRENASARK